MAPTTHERLISADDHVDLTHDSVKAHLAPRYTTPTTPRSWSS